MNHIPSTDTPQADLLQDGVDLAPVPRGAAALAGVAVALLIAAWLVTYFFFYLARGPVG